MSNRNSQVFVCAFNPKKLNLLATGSVYAFRSETLY